MRWQERVVRVTGHVRLRIEAKRPQFSRKNTGFYLTVAAPCTAAKEVENAPKPCVSR
jgi:hypothetical protein